MLVICGLKGPSSSHVAGFITWVSKVSKQGTFDGLPWKAEPELR